MTVIRGLAVSVAAFLYLVAIALYSLVVFVILRREP